ncbi:conserved hypothetical protein [Rhodospirillaceae bacterium LM-1]|nr:conserved hypothetical protein [Rhodospirillaceae bacterium LM-1]
MKNMTTSKSPREAQAHHVMLTAQDFAALGAQNLAFVRKVEEGGASQWAIFSADGTPIGMAPSRDVAFAAVRQHELEPQSVH